MGTASDALGVDSLGAHPVITKRTRYGRTVFAVGGNAEAARRAGINVARVRNSVFMLVAAAAPGRHCSASSSSVR